MRRFIGAIILLTCSPSIFAQLDSNSVTVTAYQSSTLQPDQAVFQISVAAGYNSGLSDVVAALEGSGVTAANFTGINTNGFVYQNPSPNNPPTIQWNFVLVAPLNAIKDTVTSLTNLQQKINVKGGAFQMSFYLQNTRVSPQLQQTQPCSIAGLLSDAQAQAQKLANAAGFTVGAILAMASSTTVTAGSDSIAAASPYFTPNAPNCTMTVKFALGR